MFDDPFKKRVQNGNDEIQGSLHCGGKSAAFGRDDVHLGLN